MKIKKIKMIFKLILTIFFINLGSCGLKVTDNHGQIFDSNLTTDLFKEGKTTKEEITNILGTPSIKSTFDGEKSWFYVSSEFEKFIFLDGENIDQKILELRKQDPAKYGRLTREDFIDSRYYVGKSHKLSRGSFHHEIELKAISESEVYFSIGKDTLVYGYGTNS